MVEILNLGIAGDPPMRGARVLLLALLLAGCPPRSDERKPSARPPCTSFGQTCEFAPGKLGTCVRRENCSAGDCYVCQSQH